MIEFQRAVVVGASSGIGAALARQLGQRKSRVALIARREDQLQEVAGEIQRAGAKPTSLSTTSKTSKPRPRPVRSRS